MQSIARTIIHKDIYWFISLYSTILIIVIIIIHLNQSEIEFECNSITSTHWIRNQLERSSRSRLNGILLFRRSSRVCIIRSLYLFSTLILFRYLYLCNIRTTIRRTKEIPSDLQSISKKKRQEMLEALADADDLIAEKIMEGIFYL